MKKNSFRVELQKEMLTFSAAHFITFGGNICERLHGHNYGVRCTVEGTLDQNQYVVDFIALRDALKRIVDRLDHRVLLPTDHPTISVSKLESGEGGGKVPEIIAAFEDRRWIFPEEDCVLLPVANTTAELIAQFIGERLQQEVEQDVFAGCDVLEVGVDENKGQWGVCRIDLR